MISALMIASLLAAQPVEGPAARKAVHKSAPSVATKPAPKPASKAGAKASNPGVRAQPKGARGRTATDGGAHQPSLDGGGLSDAGLLPDGGTPPKVGGEAAFLFSPDPPNDADGTILPPPEYEGPGVAVVKYAAQQFEHRERELAAGRKSLELADAALARFFKTSGGDDPKIQAKELAALAEGLEVGKTAFLAAAENEKRRLSWVAKIIRDAKEGEYPNPLPGVDLALVEARQESIREGRVRDAVELRFGGYRGLMMGIVSWVDGDTRLALERLKAGVAGTPDLPLAHLYLGYVYYILERVNDALAQWRKAQALEPNNPTIKKLIADHLHERK